MQGVWEAINMTPKFNNLYNNVLPSKNNLVVVFPGRFQPFHAGHKKIYALAKQAFPAADFFVATSDVPAKMDDATKYPFNFAEKKAIMLAAGVPEKEIVMTKQPYKPVEILKNYDSTFTKVIYLVGKKDMEADARFTFGVTKSGKPTYFQPYKDLQSMKPFDEKTGHGYVFAPSTVEFTIGSNVIKSGTELRNMYKTANDEQKKNIITQILGKFSDKIYKLFNNKIK